MTDVETLPNYIDGEFLPPSDGQYIDNFNPATGLVISRVPASKAADVEQAVAAADRAFKGEWASWSAERRADLLDQVADLITARLEEFAQAESRDAGKPLWLARSVDIPRAVKNFRFFAGAVRHQQNGCHHMADALNYTVRKPVGVAGLITPWNLPIYLLSWKVAPALAMGNTIVAKPSEMTPLTATLLARVMHDVGLPKGVFNLVHGLGGDAGQAIVAHPKVRLISFTGGTFTGTRVASTACPMFKKVSLELGGKNATIVFDDCDLEATVEGAARSAFLNSGQVCLAGSRLFIHAAIYDTFLEKFVQRVKQLQPGDPSSSTSWLGPVVSLQHKEKVLSYVKLAQEEGGQIVVGGDEPNFAGTNCAAGYFINPTVITGLSPTSRTSTEEIFGPVVTVHKFSSDDEVIEYANNTRYGLAGSVWTTNLKRGHLVAQKIDSGMIWVNCWLHRDLRVPFGGVKDSGVGREGGDHSLEFFSESQNICVKY